MSGLRLDEAFQEILRVRIQRGRCRCGLLLRARQRLLRWRRLLRGRTAQALTFQEVEDLQKKLTAPAARFNLRPG